jgi:hypothetical protein
MRQDEAAELYVESRRWVELYCGLNEREREMERERERKKRKKKWFHKLIDGQ